MSGVLITITGPSLSGKSTLGDMLREKGFAVKATTTTTRKPREGEINGDHYHFISKDEFKKKIEKNEMIEFVEFDGNFYGLSKEEVAKKLAAGSVIAVVLEPVGANAVKKYAQEENFECLQVFVCNPEDVLRKRFDARFKNDNLADPIVYENRWNSMKTVELSWRSQMQGADLFFEQFDKSNESAVCQKVMDVAGRMKNDAQSIKKLRP